MKNEGKIEISIQSKEISPTTSKEAYEFRQLVKQAGFVELDAVTQAEIGWFLPQGFNGEQLTTALNLYSQGVHSEKLEQQVDKSEKLLANLSERERQSLYAIPYLVAAFEEYDPERSSQLQTAYTPSITIQQVPSTAVSQDNRFVFERLEGYFSPVIKQVAGKGISLAKKKVKDFAAKAIEKGGKKLIKKAFKKGAGLAIKAGAKAAIAGAAQAIGTTVPVLGNIVAFIVTEVIPRLIKGATKLFSAFLRAVTGEKDFRKQLRNLAALGFVLALALGQPVLAGVAGFTAVSAQAAILGSQGISAGIAGAGQTFVYGLYAVAAPAIGIPILLALLVTPFVIAFIIFIINSGAFITPYAPSPVLQESAYISVEKVANPAGPFDNNDLPERITYTISVAATLSTLTNISFDWRCEVISDFGQTCPAFGTVTVNGESVPNVLPPPAPDVLSPVGEPYVITYTQLFQRGRFEDTATIDIFTVTADAEGSPGEKSRGSATVIIGNPPTECFEFAVGESDPRGRASIDWANDPIGQSNIMGAIGQLSLAPAYTAPLCAGGPIYLYRIPVNFGGGWASGANGGTIFLYNGGTSSYGTAVYTLAHESGHIANWRRPDIFNDFSSQGISSIEGFLHTYPNQKTIWEDFAETIGLYVGEPVYHPAKWGSFDYQARYPLHYFFARDLFGGVEY